VINTALAPFRGPGKDRFTISGPSVRLRPRTALSLSMVLHELATNAMKFGAWTNSMGRMPLHWDIDAAAPPRFRLIWSETEADVVAEPERRGFRSRLTEKVVARELAATTTLDFAATGVVCTIDAPVSEIVFIAAMMDFPPVGRMGAAWDGIGWSTGSYRRGRGNRGDGRRGLPGRPRLHRRGDSRSAGRGRGSGAV
jgi:hypothetical protein